MEIQSPLKEPQVINDQPVIHTLLYDIKQTLLQLEKAIIGKQTRLIYKILKHIKKYKKVIQGHHLEKVFKVLIPNHEFNFCKINGYNAQFAQNFDLPKSLLNRLPKMPEIEIYIRVLHIILLLRQNNQRQALDIVNQLKTKIYQVNRRSLDPLNALLYFYYMRMHQKLGSTLIIRQELFEAYNRTCLKNDQIGQATLINLILRNFLIHNHIEAAHNFIQKTTFPEGKSNNQFCKYLFYTGKVKAIRRDYSDSLNRLTQAIRKAPDSATGFKIQCQRYAIVVQLLLGDIPNRQIFSEEIIFKHTYGYYKLIQAVLNGNLSDFNEVVEKYKQRFTQDKLYTLIMRLNHIVLRVGLRKINLSYSKISLTDIAQKLKIEIFDVQSVVAKAIRDAVIIGQIDHEKQIVVIKQHKNIYETNDPQYALDKRTEFCLKLYQSIQKAITYPDAIHEQKIVTENIDPTQLLNMFDFDEDDM